MNENEFEKNENGEQQENPSGEAVTDNEPVEAQPVEAQPAEAQPVEAQPVQQPVQQPSQYGGDPRYAPRYSGQSPYGAPQYGTQGQQQYNAPQSPYSPYSQNNYAYNYNPVRQPQAAPPQKKGTSRGTKIFLALIAFVVVFALGAGAISIAKYKANPIDKDGTTAAGEVDSNNDASLNISPTPDASGVRAETGALTTAQIAKKIKPSVVGIVVYTNSSASSAGEGSGIIMGTDSTREYTYVITCAHVISSAGIKVTVQCEDGTSYDAEIVGYDIRTDVGILKIKANGLTAAEFGNSDKLQVGDPVYAIGNPGGIEFFGSFTGGFVSAIDRPVSSEIGYTMKCVQHDAAINPGNSGGALVNQYGQVVGINSQKITATNYEGMGFAIPITSAKTIIDDLIAYGYVPNRPKLGVTYYPVSASAQYSMIAQIKGLPAGTLIINKISSDSSLANTDARQYDMIIAVNGKKMDSADVLLELIDNGKIGDKLTLTLCRVNNNYSTSELEVEAILVEDKGTTQDETTTYQYVNPFEFYFGQGN